MTKKDKYILILLEIVTLTSYVLAAVLLDRFEIRAGIIWLIPVCTLLVWSIILYRKNRCWAISGFIIAIVVLILAIKLPDYHEYKKRHPKPALSAVQALQKMKQGNNLRVHNDTPCGV